MTRGIVRCIGLGFGLVFVGLVVVVALLLLDQSPVPGLKVGAVGGVLVTGAALLAAICDAWEWANE